MNPFRSFVVPATGALACLGFSAPHASAEIKYVLHITVDGLRGDLLKNLVTTLPATYPNFKKLRDEGASTFNARCDFDYSETLPNHSTIVTGRPVLDPVGGAGYGHQYTANTYSVGDTIHKLGTATYVYRVSTFDTTHDRGLSTAVYAGKTRFNLFVASYNATNGRADTVGADNGKNKIDFTSVADLTTSGAGGNLKNVKDALIADIAFTPISKLRNYNLVHFTDTDTGTTGGGHSAGWGSAAWNVAVSDVDGYLGAIFTALNAPGTDASIKGKVAIVLTADHGGGGGGAGPGPTADKNHGEPSNSLNYTVPFFIWGLGIPAGADAHTLFKNRADPAAARPTTAVTTLQPLRNVDSANIAMALLGMPLIEGSYYKPEFTATPALAKLGGNVVVNWPLYLTNYKLQSTTNLATGTWTLDAGTPEEQNDSFSRTISADPGEPHRFWRLKAPE